MMNNQKISPQSLFKLQEVENEGRGISCVRSIHLYLSLGDVGSAKAVINSEFDKIRNYPTIVQWLTDNDLMPSSVDGDRIDRDAEIQDRIYDIIDSYTTDMGAYNFGVHKGDYENIANDIIKEFGLK
jgi:hypothetical protein